MGSREALVVDDSGTARAIASSHLRALGFDVSEAEDGVRGLAVLDSLAAPVVVLVDWHMPALDGEGFVRAVRHRARHASVALIVVTTAREHARIVTALDAGADEYLMKPFTREMLRDKLALVGLETPQ